jgi:hypothetical protein
VPASESYDFLPQTVISQTSNTQLSSPLIFCPFMQINCVPIFSYSSHIFVFRSGRMCGNKEWLLLARKLLRAGRKKHIKKL